MIMVLLGLLGIASWQSATADMPGTWVADHRGTIYIRLELKAADGTLAGTMGTGTVRFDSNGDVIEAAAPRSMTMTPLLEVTVDGSSVAFATHEGNDTDHFRLTVVGADQAELTFIWTEELLAELKDEGIPMPKPFRLRRLR
jgi:hypothetical protein